MCQMYHDASVIPNAGICRELAVHNLEDLTKMALEFTAFDLESSIRQIQWKLFKHSHRFLPHCGPGQISHCEQVREDHPTITYWCC